MAKKMHLKKDDTVVVITGKDAGKKGKVLACDPKSGRIIVDKVNVVKKHSKPTKASPQGGIIEKEAYFDASNAMIYGPKCKAPVRTGRKSTEKGSVRVCKKCGENFDK